MNNNNSNVTILEKSEILLRIQKGDPLDDLFQNFDARQMQQVRDFLEKEIQYLNKIKFDTTVSLQEIRNNYEPIPNYYYKQTCREPLEACLNETCFVSNPECFSRKMKLQINTLIKLITPLLE